MSTAITAEDPNGQFRADEARTPLPLRNDTFLGVCEAIGEDVGMSPNWLRIAFAPLVVINPGLVIGAYLGLGGVVALSRWLFPRDSRPAAADETGPAKQEDSQLEEELLAA
jgi:phage shock protein PspC (stress-responsive transcriptional regulator)